MMEWQLVLHYLIEACVIGMFGFVLKYLPALLSELQKFTNIKLTDQQVIAIQNAVNTAAGILEASISAGNMNLKSVSVTQEAVRQQARAVINTVPTAAANLNVSETTVSRMIVAKLHQRQAIRMILPTVQQDAMPSEKLTVATEFLKNQISASEAQLQRLED